MLGVFKESPENALVKKCKYDSKNSRGITRCGAPHGKCQGPCKEYTCSLKQEQPETKEVDG